MSANVCAIFGYGPGLGAAAARKWSSQGYQVSVEAEIKRPLHSVHVYEEL